MQWCNSLSGVVDERDTAIGIGCELLNAGGSFETATAWQFSVVVEHIVVTFVFHTATVNGKTVVCLTHNLALIGPWPCNLVGGGISPVFRYATSGIFQIILTIALVNPRCLLEVGLWCTVVVVTLERSEGSLVLRLHLYLTAHDGNHRLGQPRVPQHVVAIEQVGLSVVVNHHRRVNLEPPFHQWFANGVLIGTSRRVRHCHPDTWICLTLDGGGHIPIPLAIALDALACPAVVVLLGPFREGRGSERCTTIGPVHHIDSAIEQPVLHGEIAVDGFVLVVVNEEVERVTMHVRCWVGCVTIVDDGVLCRYCLCSTGEQGNQDVSHLTNTLGEFYQVL